MSNPYDLTDEQMRAYSAQREKDRQSPDASLAWKNLPSVAEVRAWYHRQRVEADYIKFGDRWIFTSVEQDIRR